MSYDFGIVVDTGGPEPHHIDPFFNDEHPGLGDPGKAGATVQILGGGGGRCGNMTSNVSPMWTLCLSAAAGEKVSLRALRDEPCRELAPLLAKAVEWGVRHIEDLRRMNPENGWGDAEGAVTYLWDIQRMCERHPNGTLYLSY